MDLLVSCGRLPEAAFFARTYAPSRMTDVSCRAGRGAQTEIWLLLLCLAANNTQPMVVFVQNGLLLGAVLAGWDEARYGCRSCLHSFPSLCMQHALRVVFAEPAHEPFGLACLRVTPSCHCVDPAAISLPAARMQVVKQWQADLAKINPKAAESLANPDVSLRLLVGAARGHWLSPATLRQQCINAAPLCMPSSVLPSVEGMHVKHLHFGVQVLVLTMSRNPLCCPVLACLPAGIPQPLPWH